MTPEEKWLLIFGSGWVDWRDVMGSEHGLLFHALPREKKQMNTNRNQVRLKPQHEPIRVHVAPTPGVHTI